ncbi:hypothetical protein SRABI36_05006 [Pedobacter sp. Bi36]|nr:hypothetical protein SRABI36_05006 [Pedobacter sp. Bi36]CAH0316900.1 hypothetical protein SRABI126_05042 [Pedobacter sp. Bi126]
MAIFDYQFNLMLLFAVPLYFITFFGWIIYAALIKKNLKQNMPMFYFGGVFSLIWMVIVTIAYI